MLFRSRAVVAALTASFPVGMTRAALAAALARSETEVDALLADLGAAPEDSLGRVETFRPLLSGTGPLHHLAWRPPGLLARLFG